MNVSIKERKMEGGKTALYLHTFNNGKRQRKSLELTLYTNPETTEQRRENKMTLELAERLRAEALINLQDKKVGINRKDHTKDNFVDFFEKKGLERFDSTGNYGNWDGSMKQFIKCFGKNVLMEEVDLDLARKFKNYLEFEAKTKHGTPLSQNSRHTYFNKFKACVGLAFREKVIKENIADYIDSFKQAETHREHLTFEELEKLAKTPCTYPNLKNAFLFSCLTGMRWSDINTLHWKQIRYSETNGYEIVFKQQKTGGQEYLPINDSAFDLLPERGPDNAKVFVGIKYSAYLNVVLFRWVVSAGITKHITFHCGRHTHAVLLLTNGIDIYTVSKLLGHKSITTTQIYAHIVDSKKKEAVNSIPKLNL
jgi:integrase